MIGDIDLEKSLTAAQIVKTPALLNMSAPRKSITAKPTNLDVLHRFYFCCKSRQDILHWYTILKI